jgi:hypothetical protein
VTVSAKRLPPEEIEALLHAHDFGLVVDATHTLRHAHHGEHRRRLRRGRHGLPAPAARDGRHAGGRRLRRRRRRGTGLPRRYRGQRPAHHRQQGPAGLRRHAGIRRARLCPRPADAGFARELRRRRAEAGAHLRHAGALLRRTERRPPACDRRALARDEGRRQRRRFRGKGRRRGPDRGPARGDRPAAAARGPDPRRDGGGALPPLRLRPAPAGVRRGHRPRRARGHDGGGARRPRSRPRA